MASKSGKFSKTDLKKWGWNSLLFAAPALLVLASSIVDIVPKDSFYGVIALYLLNVIVDYLRKLNAGK